MSHELYACMSHEQYESHNNTGSSVTKNPLFKHHLEIVCVLLCFGALLYAGVSRVCVSRDCH